MRETLDNRIIGGMKTWGGNYDSNTGGNHNTSADKRDPKITNKEQMGNPKELDPMMAKPSNKNPGVDKAFLAKGNPQMDTTGHGKLTRSCCD